MKLSHIMSHDPVTVSPDQTIQAAAEIMARLETGFLPVARNGGLLGTLTDRDIVVRALAAGKGLETAVDEVMTRDVQYCRPDDDSADVVETMRKERIRRILVVDRDERLVGMVSLGDLALRAQEGEAEEALAAISRPGGPHA